MKHDKSLQSILKQLTQNDSTKVHPNKITLVTTNKPFIHMKQYWSIIKNSYAHVTLHSFACSRSPSITDPYASRSDIRASCFFSRAYQVKLTILKLSSKQLGHDNKNDTAAYLKADQSYSFTGIVLTDKLLHYYVPAMIQSNRHHTHKQFNSSCQLNLRLSTWPLTFFHQLFWRESLGIQNNLQTLL